MSNTIGIEKAKQTVVQTVVRIAVGGDGVGLDWCHECGFHPALYYRPSKLDADETAFVARMLAPWVVMMDLLARQAEQAEQTCVVIMKRGCR